MPNPPQDLYDIVLSNLRMAQLMGVPTTDISSEVREALERFEEDLMRSGAHPDQHLPT